MSRRKDLLDQVMADRLAAMGEEPSAETLLEWRQGRLSEAEREELLERAAVDPQLAKQLLDMLDFPELRAEESDELPWDTATRDAKWRRFTERLQAEGESFEPSAGPASRKAPRRWMPLAASLILGVVLGAMLARLGSLPDPTPPEPSPPNPAPQVAALRNVESLSLSLDGTPGDRGGSLEKRASAEWIQLVLPSVGLPVAESYSVQVLAAEGREIFRQDGLVPGSGGRLTALIAADLFVPGGYRARLFAGNDFDEEAIATASWIVTLGPS